MRNSKVKIRKEILCTLNNQAQKELLRKSEEIKKKLFSMPEFKKSQVVMLYASKNGEVNTSEMIDEALRAGKRVALPRTAGQEAIVAKEIKTRQEDLEIGAYGICEPKEHNKTLELEEIDLIVVPGVAFDKRNRRLGRGKGYYDRFLKKLPPGKISVGIAFNFQIVNSLPEDSHDVPVSTVITD